MKWKWNWIVDHTTDSKRFNISLGRELPYERGRSVINGNFAINGHIGPPRQVQPPTEQHDTTPVSRAKRGIANTGKLWPQNRVVTVSFMDVPSRARRLIKQCAATYSPLVNIQFKFVKDPDADIRISTHEDIQGNWSCLGTDALKVPKHKPTMHFDIQHTTETMLAMTVLHEFGHALGLEHEHQHPDRTLDFNTPKTYTIYKDSTGLDKIKIYLNVLKKLNRAEHTYSAYDANSIMHYNFPASVLWKQDATGDNLVLSEQDKAFLATLYPLAPPPSEDVNTLKELVRFLSGLLLSPLSA
ncbi:M12 family metallopeptidase [Pseudomonas sp. FP2309]|uniref:M12 family metallopeptidase n=1 Tax=Pseudomonas sp. FP2309 TaxID=2954091 RepID=UPI0027324149|nr:M12 family metallopeptidase [Pseudomonas sp. FP2309]WLH66324.1 M12 family metallopeptidase [Pseudomonas sp. FP2309]